MQLRLRTKGLAAHSGTPELGRSAIWPLLDWLQRLREVPTANDAELGPEVWNLGMLHGGGAPNVVPANAEASLFVRSLPDSQFLARARELAPAEGAVEELSFTPPERFPHVPGFPHAPVTFGSDAPRVRELVPTRRIALCGPGTIRVAHTLDEHITGTELRTGCELLVALAENFLQSNPS